MMTLLPLLLAPLASAAPLVSCVAEVSVGDHRLRVSGHGGDEAAARARAVLEGRQAATRLLHSQVWREIFFADPAALAPSLLDAPIEPKTGVPGATWEPGACSTRDVAEPRTWVAELQGHTATRTDPGIAMSAARRLACETAWVEPAARAFDAVATAPGADKARILAEGLDAADAALLACYAAPPDVRSTKAARSDIGVPNGIAECRAAGPAMSKGPMGLGWGPTADAAIDHAAWERAWSAATTGLAVALEARAKATVDMKTMLMAKGMQTALFAHDTELGEMGLVSCVHAPTGVELAWGPRGAEDRACADPEDFQRWRTGDLGNAGQHRDVWCGEHLRGGAGQIDKAIGVAAPEQRATLQAAGWGIVMDCTARCRMGTAAQGPNIPMNLPGIVPFDAKTAVVLLKAAVGDRDIGRASLIVPALNTADARGMRAKDADAFWGFVGQLVQGLEAGELPKDARWSKFGGHAILVLPTR